MHMYAWYVQGCMVCMQDSDDEIATKQLTAVVDVTFLPHDNPEIS